MFCLHFTTMNRKKRKLTIKKKPTEIMSELMFKNGYEIN